MTNVSILLPPSEGKALGGTRGEASLSFGPALDKQRASLKKKYLAAVRNASAEEREKLLNVKGPLLARALESVRELSKKEPLLLPAWERFSGVVWTHLDASTLPDEVRHRILVPNGLYGLVRGTDTIADFRLKMSVKIPEVGIVAEFWKSSVTATLLKEVATTEIFDLLPNEHRRSIDLSSLSEGANFHRIDFVTSTGANAAGHAAKAVKGVLARHLVTAGPKVLPRFSWEGWRTVANGNDWIVTAP
jgi:cytoplasmic iron level regulating protein YaaA (DUF328/UPF0246 family)